MKKETDVISTFDSFTKNESGIYVLKKLIINISHPTYSPHYFNPKIKCLEISKDNFSKEDLETDIGFLVQPDIRSREYLEVTRKITPGLWGLSDFEELLGSYIGNDNYTQDFGYFEISEKLNNKIMGRTKKIGEDNYKEQFTIKEDGISQEEVDIFDRPMPIKNRYWIKKDEIISKLTDLVYESEKDELVIKPMLYEQLNRPQKILKTTTHTFSPAK